MKLILCRNAKPMEKLNDAYRKFMVRTMRRSKTADEVTSKNKAESVSSLVDSVLLCFLTHLIPLSIYKLAPKLSLDDLQLIRHLFLSTRTLHRGINQSQTRQNQSLVVGSCLEAEQRGTKKTILYLENGHPSRFCLPLNFQNKKLTCRLITLLTDCILIYPHRFLRNQLWELQQLLYPLLLPPLRFLSMKNVQSKLWHLFECFSETRHDVSLMTWLRKCRDGGEEKNKKKSETISSSSNVLPLNDGREIKK